MKKLLFLSAFLLVGFFAANAQVYHDDCEGYAPFTINPTTGPWTFYDLDGDTTYRMQDHSYPNQRAPHAFIVFNPDSMVSPLTSDYGTPHSGKQYFACWQSFHWGPQGYGGSDAANTVNNAWLVSPELSGEYQVRLSFAVRGFQSGTSTQEKYRVAHSVTGGDPGVDAFITHNNTLPNITLTTSDWQEVSYDFPVGTKYVGINCVSDNGFFLMVDDIEVRELFTKELEAWALGFNSYSCDLTDTETVEIGVINRGIETVNEFDIVYQIGENGLPVVQHITGANLASGDTGVYVFDVKADLTFEMDSDSLRGWVVCTGDGLNTNDTTEWYGAGRPNPALPPYANDFETEEQLKGWSSYDVNEDGYTWRYTQDDDGNYTWFCQTFGANAANDWLFSSCFDLAAGEYTLEFLHKVYAAYNTEKLAVYYGTAIDPDAMTLIGDFTFSDADWTSTAQNFTVAEDNVYYIAFKGHSDANQGDIYFDKFSLRPAAAKDIAVLTATAPAISCDMTANETLAMKVKNLGTETITSFKAYYQIDSAAAVEEEVTAEIAPAAEYTYTFTTPADLTVAAPAKINFWTSLEGDDNYANDTVITPSTSGLVAAVSSPFENHVYANDFSTESDVMNWTVENPANDGETWVWNSDGYWAFTGSSYYTGHTGGNAWLFSSCFDLEAKDYLMKFNYTVNSELPANLKFYFGKTKTMNTDELTIIDELTMFAPDNWATYEGTFSVPEAGTYYFALNGYDAQMSLFIDKLELHDNVAVTENAAASFSVYPNPANSVLNVKADDVKDIEILNMLGQTVATTNVNTINVANLTNGVYFVRVNFNNGEVATQKFVKE